MKPFPHLTITHVRWSPTITLSPTITTHMMCFYLGFNAQIPCLMCVISFPLLSIFMNYVGWDITTFRETDPISQLCAARNGVCIQLQEYNLMAVKWDWSDLSPWHYKLSEQILFLITESASDLSSISNKYLSISLVTFQDKKITWVSPIICHIPSTSLKAWIFTVRTNSSVTQLLPQSDSLLQHSIWSSSITYGIDVPRTSYNHIYKVQVWRCCT